MDGLSVIDIGYDESGNFHHFTFSDDGIGIMEDDGKELFKLFHRQSAHDRVDGTGLWLAIVKEIIAIHGGWVRVERGKNGGTVFHLFFSSHL